MDLFCASNRFSYLCYAPKCCAFAKNKDTLLGALIFWLRSGIRKIKSKLPVAAWSMPAGRHRNLYFLRSRKCKRIPAAPYYLWAAFLLAQSGIRKIKSKLPVAAWSVPAGRHRYHYFLRRRKCKRIPNSLLPIALVLYLVE